MVEDRDPQRSGVRFGVWSTFRELLGWADDAGPMPKSLAIVGWVLAIASLAFGVVAVAVLDHVVLGVVSGLIGMGLLLGTVDLN